MSTTRKLTIGLLAVALLATAAFGTTATAAPGRGHADDHRGDGNHTADADERREAAKERREAMANKSAEMRAKHAAVCADPANETVEKRCEALNKTAPAAKARREAHAIVKAIEAHERILGRVAYKLDGLRDMQASGNYTGNLTADDVADRIEKLEERHDRLVEKISALRERLEALHQRWEEARAMREAGEDADDDA